MLRKANDTFWDRNDAYVSGEMSQVQMIVWVATMAVVTFAMMAALWLVSR